MRGRSAVLHPEIEAEESMRIKRIATLIVAALCVLPILALSAAAGPTDPVTVEDPPTDQGLPFLPGVRLVEDLAQEYVEEEFFISGEATLYNYGHNPPNSPTDIVSIDEDVPYRTRIIVRRPSKPSKANGTVVIEWWNSTAGFDTAPAWDVSAEYFANEGVTYVGVTNSTTSLGFMVTGCRLFGVFPPACGTRYATLSMPENGLAYDIVNQIANLLKSDDPSNPLPKGFRPDIVLHAGESQQAGSVVTFATAFHEPGVSDGYFVQSGFSARPINFGPACGSEGALPFPDCTPRLAYPASLVDTNLPVPVYQTVTQTDFEGLGFSVFARQPDTPTYRYYEITGGSHTTVHKGVELVPGDPPVLLSDLCLEELNTLADGPVFGAYVLNALWERMQEQVLDGAVPPAGVLMDTSASFDLLRDANENVLGGVRLPSITAPTATYVSTATANPALPAFLAGFANLVCRLSGAVQPFDQATLDGLYPEHAAYVSAVADGANSLKAQGLLLQQDAVKIKAAAGQSDIGK
jgi:hypothetical protein